MSTVFTLKLPPALLTRLEDASDREGRSKGEIVREALSVLFDKGMGDLESVRRITEAYRQNKKTRQRADWDLLYRKTRVETGLTPEEEVLRSRRRLR